MNTKKSGVLWSLVANFLMRRHRSWVWYMYKSISFIHADQWSQNHAGEASQVKTDTLWTSSSSKIKKMFNRSGIFCRNVQAKIIYKCHSVIIAHISFSFLWLKLIYLALFNRNRRVELLYFSSYFSFISLLSCCL